MSLLVAPALDVEQVIAIQRQRIAQREYEMLGRIKVIVFEPARGAATPQPGETNVWGVRLDWMSEGPFIALSSDHADLLIPTPMMHPPDIPHPSWMPTSPTDRCPADRMIHQSYAERASGKLRGTNFLIFQPVAQILYRGEGRGGFGLINARANPANGTQMALLIDPAKCEAHLYGGLFGIKR